MQKIGRIASRLGYTLRSGGADGADTAFEKGCDEASGLKEIYLPWKSFNNNASALYNISKEALELAKEIHPAWDRLSHGGRMLQARNCYQILGEDLKTPALFVVCWHTGSGGTMQAVRLAKKHNIPVFNLYVDKDKEDLKKFLKLKASLYGW